MALSGSPPRSVDVHPHSGWNLKVAVWITEKVGSMWAAYLFAGLALLSLPAALTSHSPLIIVGWIAQTFLQLVLLPVIMVGQNVQSRMHDVKAEQDHLALTELQMINQRQLEILRRLEGKPRSNT